MKYYKHIYTEDINIDDEDNSFFIDTDTKLNNEEKQSCEGHIDDNECKSAIKDMKNTKSPGFRRSNGRIL